MQNKINNINEDMNGIKDEVSIANEKLYGIEIKIDSLECEDKSMKEIQIEQNNILGSLLHNSEAPRRGRSSVTRPSGVKKAPFAKMILRSCRNSSQNR